jgi:methionine-gamma-lyase
VHYPGLPSHPQHDLATKLFGGGFGGMLAFELAGGAAAVERFFGGLRGIEFAPSFGDVTTTWSYPTRTSHRPLSAEEQAELGIDAGLVRLSVGIEDVEDLRDGLAAALGAAGS